MISDEKSYHLRLCSFVGNILFFSVFKIFSLSLMFSRLIMSLGMDFFGLILWGLSNISRVLEINSTPRISLAELHWKDSSTQFLLLLTTKTCHRSAVRTDRHWVAPLTATSSSQLWCILPLFKIWIFCSSWIFLPYFWGETHFCLFLNSQKTSQQPKGNCAGQGWTHAQA